MYRELISDAILAECKLIKNTKYEVPININSVLYLVYVFSAASYFFTSNSFVPQPFSIVILFFNITKTNIIRQSSRWLSW